MFVHDPKPSCSIASTIAITRLWRSGWPCGKSPKWVILAAVNNMADALGHAATHAPQPMHAAASKAVSASSFGIGIDDASGAAPVFTDT